MFVVVESVCTALIPAPQASFVVQFPVVGWESHRDRIITVTTSKPPSPYEQLSPLPTPVLRCFWKDLLMTTTPLQASFTATPLPIHYPFSPHKNVDHTLGCSVFYGVYNMSVVVSHVLVSIKK